MPHKSGRSNYKSSPGHKRQMPPLPKQMASHMKQMDKANRYAKTRPPQAQG